MNKTVVRPIINKILRPVLRPVKYIRYMNRINMGLSRGAATSALRQIDITNPNSWEFCGLSQHGEDGVIDFLSRKILKPNRYFIEIGAGDGIENNTAWLAIARRYLGLMIEGNRKTYECCRDVNTILNSGVETICLFVDKNNINTIQARALYSNPDLFSLDIDSNDYYLAETVLECGFRPKIFVVEYNSAFGPHKAVTIKYQKDFDNTREHSHFLYYGCSISGWKELFLRFGYKFVTVESNGVNAFFIDPREFDEMFVRQLKGLDFQEHASQAQKLKMNWEKQFDLIKDTELFEISR